MNIEIIGFIGAALMVVTLAMKTMIPLRAVTSSQMATLSKRWLRWIRDGMINATKAPQTLNHALRRCVPMLAVMN